MESDVQALKHNMYELEYAISIKDFERAKNVSRLIKSSIENIENEINFLTNAATSVYYKHINTIKFLYKPVEVSDPYKGNYLENYSKSRTSELESSGAKEGHDSFWLEHSVLNANVFGLVPVDLIPNEASKALKNLGWIETDVDVLDFGQKDSDLKNIYSFCKQSFENYVALKEQQTNSTIVLMFAS